MVQAPGDRVWVPASTCNPVLKTTVADKLEVEIIVTDLETGKRRTMKGDVALILVRKGNEGFLVLAGTEDRTQVCELLHTAHDAVHADDTIIDQMPADPTRSLTLN